MRVDMPHFLRLLRILVELRTFLWYIEHPIEEESEPLKKLKTEGE